MAPTYELIASNTLSTSAASVTFSSIPATYTDLVLRVSARDTSSNLLYIQFNSDTGTNYSRTRIRGSGSGSTSARSTDSDNVSIIALTLSTYTANTFGNAEIYIPSYTASQNKPISSFGLNETNATTAYIEALAGLWRDTSAITSITLTGNDTIESGSSFFLYGIKNS